MSSNCAAHAGPEETRRLRLRIEQAGAPVLHRPSRAVIDDPADAQAAVAPALLRQQERVPVPPHVLVNPVVEVLEPGPAEVFEGCLSVDGYPAIVPRARRERNSS